MERSILNEVSNANVTAYVNAKKEALLRNMFWQKFFPLKYTTQLTWESLSGSGGTPVMADVIQYNASAPLKSRTVISKMTGDIPKIAVKRQMDEKDMNEYTQLKAASQGDANKGALLDIVFNDVDFVYTAVMARTEFLAMQALSHGDITLTTANNNGIVTESVAKMGIPTANKTAVGISWATAATATPIADIEKVKAQATATGCVLNYIVMDAATLALMKATTEVKDKYALWQRLDSNRKADPTTSELQNLLTAFELPQIIVVNSTVRFENSKHVLTSLATWKTGYVTFITDLAVGNVLHGPIAEENSESLSKKAIMSKKDHVLVSKWSELEPYGEFTKAQANAFPRFNDVDSIFILKTNGTAWN